MLTRIVNWLFDVTLHGSTLHRYLKQAGMVWCRAAPTLKIRDPHYDEKRLAIEQALAQDSAANPVFYQDEVDIDLNPKIGADWMPKKGSRSVSPRRDRTRNIIWPAHCIRVRGESLTSVATARVLIYLSIC
ncbi:hypothetical protein OS42_46110 [Dickeya oryzae]